MTRPKGQILEVMECMVLCGDCGTSRIGLPWPPRAAIGDIMFDGWKEIDRKWYCPHCKDSHEQS